MPPTNEFQALLAEDRWIRRLAAKLVADSGAADDLVQEAYLTALSSEVRPHSPRAWLAGIMRNLWRDLARSGARRKKREAAVARPEAMASTDELVAEVELRRRVAELVLELEEPLRRALILRFFKDHSLPALAKAEGISVSTAHERVERGLAQLRTRLDATHGGERRAWALTLAALTGPRGWTTLGTSGGVTMAAGIKVAALLFALAGALAWGAHERKRDLTTHAIVLGEDRQMQLETGLTTLAQPSVRPPHEARSAEGGSSSTADASAAVVATLRGRVLDARRAPLAGIPIGRIDPMWSGVEPCGESASDGRFEMPWPAPSTSPHPMALAPGRATLASERVDGEWLLVLTDTAAYSGLVVDESGTRQAGVELSIQPRRGYFREHGDLRPLDPNQDGWKTKTDADGRFALSAAPAGEPVEVFAFAAGHAPTWMQVPSGHEQDVCVVLQRALQDVPLTGIVIGPAGEPLAGARVTTGSESSVSGEDGGFTRFWRPAAIYTEEAPSGTVQRRSETHINAFKEGYGPVQVELSALDVREPLVLELRAPLAIRGRVVNTRGEPLARVIVWPSDPTPLGTVEGGSVASDASSFGIRVENFLQRDPCQTAADGTFELDQLLERSYHLQAFDRDTATYGGPYPIEAGASGVVLQLDRESGTQRVAGRLVTADGAPLTCATVRFTRQIPVGPSFQPPLSGMEEFTTDAEGRFEFPLLAVEGTSLTFFHPEFFFFACPLEHFDDLQHLELVAPTLCELQIELADPALARSARVLDGADQPLSALQLKGLEATMCERIFLVAGKSEVVRISDAARTLVLYRGNEEVQRLPIRIDPDQRTVLRQ